MGVIEAIKDSVAKVILGIVGFGFFMYGGQQAAFGGNFGVIWALGGVVLMVAAVRI